MKKGLGAVALFLGLVITVGIGVRACLDLPEKMASRTAQGVREGITEIFVDLLHVRPEVREGTKVTWGQTSARTEIVVAEKRIKVEYDWEHQWMGSKKTIRLGQEYLVKWYRDWETDRKSTRLNSSHSAKPRMPSSA